MEYVRYNWFTNIYTTPKRIEVLDRCNSISFTNVGDAPVTVDGKILYPGTIGTALGDSFTVGGNANEIVNKKQVTISFGAGANPALEVMQKAFEK